MPTRRQRDLLRGSGGSLSDSETASSGSSSDGGASQRERDLTRGSGDSLSESETASSARSSGGSSSRRSSRPSTETVSATSTVGLSARERQLTANPSASSGASDSTPAQFNTSETDNFVGSGTVSGISSGVDFDPTREPSTDPVDRVRAPLDDLSGQLQPTLRSAGDFAGRGIATASLAPAIEEQAFGTRRSEDAIRGGSQEAAAVLDLPGLASAGIGAADFTVRGTGDDRTRREAATEAGTQGASDFASAFSERPVETTGRAVGAVGGGFAVGTAAARGTRRAAQGVDRPDFDLGFGSFAGDTRAQTGVGRTRRRGDDEDGVITGDDLDAAFGSDPTDIGTQRLLSSDNPRISASEAGRQQVRDREIEAGRRQDAPADRAQPSGRDRDIFSTAPDSGDIRTASRSPDTGPAPGTQPRGRGLDTDLSPLDAQLAAQQGQRTTGFDLRSADRASNIPSSDLRTVTGATGTQPGFGTGAGVGSLSAVNDPSGIGNFDTRAGVDENLGFGAPGAAGFAGLTGVTGQSGIGDLETGLGQMSDSTFGIGSASGDGTSTDMIAGSDSATATGQLFGIRGSAATGTQATQSATSPGGFGGSLVTSNATTATSGLTDPGLGAPTRPPGGQRPPLPRVPEFESADRDRDDFGFDIEEDDDIFDSGILSGEDAADRFFGTNADADSRV